MKKEKLEKNSGDFATLVSGVPIRRQMYGNYNAYCTKRGRQLRRPL